MQFERKITKVGGGLYIAIPADLCRYLELEEGTPITIQDETGKHGKYLSMWENKKQ